MKTILLASIAFAFALTACGGDGSPSGTQSSPASDRPTSTGTITIVEPAEGAQVPGPDVAVRVRVDGATIITSGTASRDVQPDTGHVHVLLKDLSGGGGGEGRTLTLLAGAEYTIEDLQPGRYIVTVEFAAADHGSFDPRVKDAVTITVT